MEAKEVAQLVVSGVAPFIAAGAALWIAALQRRELISVVIGHDYDHQRYGDIDYFIVHNRSTQPVAITSIRYLSGVVWRTPQQGTALDYEDPTDINFPYLVQPGALLRLRLDSHAARKIASRFGVKRRRLAWLLRRSRLLVECRSSSGARYRTSGEPILPWDDQLPWRRGR